MATIPTLMTDRLTLRLFVREDMREWKAERISE